MRTVKIISTQFNSIPKSIQSSATTWGELKNDLDSNDVVYTNSDIFERASRNQYSVDEAVLPEGDFTIFIYPQKVKQGANPTSTSVAELHEITYNNLRSLASQLGLPITSSDTKESMVKMIASYNIGATANGRVSSNEVNMEDVVDATESLELAIQQLYESVGLNVNSVLIELSEENTTEAEDDLSPEDIEALEEYKRLRG